MRQKGRPREGLGTPTLPLPLAKMSGQPQIRAARCTWSHVHVLAAINAPDADREGCGVTGDVEAAATDVQRRRTCGPAHQGSGWQ